MNSIEIALSGLVGAILGSAISIWFAFKLEHERFQREAGTRFLGWIESISNELARVQVKCGRVAGYGRTTGTQDSLRDEANRELERFAERLSNLEPLAGVKIAFGRESAIADAANEWVKDVDYVANLVRTNSDSPEVHKRVEEELDPVLLAKRKHLAGLILDATAKRRWWGQRQRPDADNARER